VVAIILIIAAIAIPNLLRSRIAANEAATVGALRTLNTSEVTFETTYPDLGFQCDLASMGLVMVM
jgi:type IV pilus assembly protein PilA